MPRQVLNSSGDGDYTDFQGNLSQCLTSHSEEFLLYIGLEFPLFRSARFKKYQLWLFEAWRTASVGKSQLLSTETGKWKEKKKSLSIEFSRDTQTIDSLFSQSWSRYFGQGPKVLLIMAPTWSLGQCHKEHLFFFVFVSNSTTNQLFRKYLSFTHCGFWRLKAPNILPGYNWLDKISEEKIMQRITRHSEIAQEMLLNCLHN